MKFRAVDIEDEYDLSVSSITSELRDKKIEKIKSELESKACLVDGGNLVIIGDISEPEIVAETKEYIEPYFKTKCRTTFFTRGIEDKGLVYAVCSQCLAFYEISPRNIELKTKEKITEENILELIADWKTRKTYNADVANIGLIAPNVMVDHKTGCGRYLTKEENKVIESAAKFKNDMKKNGFAIGHRGIEIIRPIFAEYRDFIFHPVFVGFELTSRAKEHAYIHCGSGGSLGLRCPVVEIEFLHLNEKAMKKHFRKNQEGILAGFKESDRVELEEMSPTIQTLKEAKELYENIEKWLKRNGERAKSEFSRRFEHTYIIHCKG